MEESYMSTLNSLRQECFQAEQQVADLKLAYQRLDFEKTSQINDLAGKLWKATQDYNQLFYQFQANQAAFEELKGRTNHLEAENVYLNDQLRYAAASESDLRQSATHYFEKSNKLEFTVDYKNYLLSNQQELHERDVDLRADLEFLKSTESSQTQMDEQPTVSVNRADIIEEPESYLPKVSAPPSRTQSFGRCQREASKSSRLLSNGRLLRKLTANKVLAAPKRR